VIVRHNLSQTAAAEFSADEVYRYRLRRSFVGSVLDKPENPVVFIMLNPSTANAIDDDPTIRRCCSFARAWGHSDLLVVNLFALRSTDPDALLSHADPVGPENNEVLADLPRCKIVVAWGSHIASRKRAEFVATILESDRLNALGVTLSGAPKHPLYLRADSLLIPWSATQAGQKRSAAE
jgi:hypothetical protein